MQKHHPDTPSAKTPSKLDSSSSQNASDMTQQVTSPESVDSSSSSLHTITTQDESSTEPTLQLPADLSPQLAADATPDAAHIEIFECKECSMKFLSSQLLAEHSVEHTGERPYECEICGVKFTHKFALRSHKLSHDADYSQHLKDKLKTVNRNTAIANSALPLETQIGQHNFIYKKSIRNMIGLKDNDDSVKQTLKNLVQHTQVKNKIIQEESEKIICSNSSVEKTPPKQTKTMSHPESVLESISHVFKILKKHHIYFCNK